MALILDTGVVLAALNRRDAWHQRCVDLLTGATEPLVVPAAILFEIDYWIHERLTPDVWQMFVEDIHAGAYILEPTTTADLLRAAELQQRYANLELGFTDGAVIALCERMREPKVATIDRRDFAVVVPRHVPALELLPH